MQERKKPAINPDADPLAWAKAVCTRRTPSAAQSDNLTKVRDAAVVMIMSIIQTSRASVDRTTAIRKVREALKFAEDSIILDWEGL